MFVTVQYLRKTLAASLKTLETQGFDITGMEEKLAALSDSYDAFISFARELCRLPFRRDWPYVEPVSWEEIQREMAPGRERFCRPADVGLCVKKAETAFLASVLGCILGKPLEVNPDLESLRRAGEAAGQWPVKDFITPEFLDALGRRHFSWTETTKGRIHYAAADDDLNYSVLGMLALEEHGLQLDLDGMKRTWLRHQAMGFAFGPEQHITACIAANRLMEEEMEPHHPDRDYSWWADLFNPMNEECGAIIRMDAYGYAFAGRPDMAARYACIDASFTHRRTGVYSAMYVAAVLAGMFTACDPVEPFVEALNFIPCRSRFYRACQVALQCVLSSHSFEEGYEKIHHRFEPYGHCMVYQEIGTLMNTMRWAKDVWHGVCLQVMQGNDTDSFGCTAGSMLGAYFGPKGLDPRRLEPFENTIHISLADFYENSLTRLARRMSLLPGRFLPLLEKEGEP